MLTDKEILQQSFKLIERELKKRYRYGPFMITKMGLPGEEARWEVCFIMDDIEWYLYNGDYVRATDKMQFYLSLSVRTNFTKHSCRFDAYKHTYKTYLITEGWRQSVPTIVVEGIES